MATYYVSTTGNDSDPGSSGAPFLTIAHALATISAGDTIAVKTGTYTITSALTIPNLRFIMRGYNSTLGDLDADPSLANNPLITCATNSVNIMQGNFNSPQFVHISMSSTAGTRGKGIYASSGSNHIELAYCSLDGFTYGIDGENAAGFALEIHLFACDIKNCSTYGVIGDRTIDARYCWFRGNAIGVFIFGGSTQAFGQLNLSYCLVTGNTTAGVKVTTSGGNGKITIDHCTIANNTADGVLGTTNNPIMLFWNSNAVYGNGGWGFAAGSTVIPVVNQNNAYGSNTSGNLSGFSTGSTDVTGILNPFVNSGAGDYSLATSATSLIGAGFPGALPGGTTSASSNMGAIDKGSGAGGGTAGPRINPGMAGGING